MVEYHTTDDTTRCSVLCRSLGLYIDGGAAAAILVAVPIDGDGDDDGNDDEMERKK